MENNLKSEAEKQAIALGNDKKALRKRLNEGARILTGKSPSKWVMDFDKKTLSGDGYTVQWVVRQDIGKPISYHNQQTTVGNCFLVF